MRQLSEERLNKQAGPGTKRPPLRDMWQQNPLNPCPHPPKVATLNPSHSHQSHTNSSAYPAHGARRRKVGGREGWWWWWGNSIPIHRMSPPYKRGPHDTATKSELMDSFLSPVNMTGGVCVRVRGCGRGTEAVRVPVCPIEGAHGPMSLVWYSEGSGSVFSWGISSLSNRKLRVSFNTSLF